MKLGEQNRVDKPRRALAFALVFMLAVNLLPNGLLRPMQAKAATHSAGSYTDLLTALAKVETDQETSTIISITADIVLEAPIAITTGGDITIQTSGGNKKITSAAGQRHFTVQGPDVTFKDLTLVGGGNGGGIEVAGGGQKLESTTSGEATITQLVANDSVVKLNNVHIQNSRGATYGGGLYIYGGAAAQMDNSSITGSQATYGGAAAVLGTGSSLLIFDSNISNNTAIQGGGLYVKNHATVKDTTISGNTATYGGGIYNEKPDGTVTIPVEDDDDEEIDLQSSFTLDSGAVVSGNEATGGGGGVYNTGILLAQNGSQITANSVGGGVYNTGTFYAYGEISGNYNDGDGGGITHMGGGLRMDYGANISGNQSQGNGGGVKAGAGTRVYIYNVSISSNTAMGSGGGVYASGVSLLTSSSMGSITDNTAYSYGGGLYLENYNDNESQRIFQETQVSGNKAANGGGLAIRNGTVIGGSITGNRAGNGGGVYLLAGGVYRAGYLPLSDNRAIDGGDDSFTYTGGNGGGAYLDGSGAILMVTDAEISSNKADNNGGGVYVKQGQVNHGTGEPISTGTAFENNEAGGVGGAIYLQEYGSVRIGESSYFSGNQSSDPVLDEIDDVSKAYHAQYIHNGTDFSNGHNYAYNNDDINYIDMTGGVVPDKESPLLTEISANPSTLYYDDFVLLDAAVPEVDKQYLAETVITIRGEYLELFDELRVEYEQEDGLTRTGSVQDIDELPSGTSEVTVVIDDVRRNDGTDARVDTVTAYGIVFSEDGDDEQERDTIVRVLPSGGTATYSVLYRPGRGTGTMTDSRSYNAGETANILENTFTPPANSTFQGFTVSGGDGTIYAHDADGIAGALSSIQVDENITLVAQWSDTYSIRYTAGRGTGADYYDDTRYYAGESADILDNRFDAPEGYTFVGFKASGRDTIYASASDGIVGAQNTIIVNRDLVFTAQWDELAGGGEVPGPEEPGGETPGTEEPGGETPGTEEPGGEIPGTEEPDPEIPDEPDDEGSDGYRGGGGGSGFRGGGQYNRGPAVFDILEHQADRAVNDYVKARNDGETPDGKPIVAVENAGYITREQLERAASGAREASGRGNTVEVTLHLDTTSTINGQPALEGRIYLNPEGGATDIWTGVYVNNASTSWTKNIFQSKYPGQSVSVISLQQRGTYGQTLEIAADADLTGLNGDNLYFYAYDPYTGGVERLANTEYFVDTAGFLHFQTGQGGDIVVTDQPLTLEEDTDGNSVLSNVALKKEDEPRLDLSTGEEDE